MPPDYLRDAGALKIVKTVHIEALWDPTDPAGETRWLDEVAREYGYPHAVIGAALFARDDIEEVLAKHAKSKLVRGVRNFPAAAETIAQEARGAAGSMDDPKWRRGYALLEKYGFSFDLQTPWWHFDAAADLARDFPNTQMVIVHTGLPNDRSAEGLAGWRAALETVAKQPNVALKISGLGRPGLPWTLTANGGIIRDAINIFGPERAMFASNYPVDSLAGSFQMIYGGFRAAVSNRQIEERRMLFHDNAVRIYRL
jgi:predicted TIM-barrel fold metal-dependent hydrolase